MAEIRELQVEQGTVQYRDIGSGPPIVFVHGALVAGDLWDGVVASLANDYRCIVPELPLGAHRVPLRKDADLSPPGLARLVTGVFDALDLDDVTLVGNDTGGAICQLVATSDPKRLGRLVLTNCDAFDNFLPPAFAYLQVAARIPGALTVLGLSQRIRPMRQLPIAYGWLSHRRIPDEALDGWASAIGADPGIRRDLAKVLKGISKRYTLDAAAALASFDRPALIAWGRDDRFFATAYAERLATVIPGARLELIDGARTFVSIDQPERLGSLIADFVRETTAERGGARAPRTG
jgi:pimeloyl-ACP methyl ester carboxylesterase